MTKKLSIGYLASCYPRAVDTSVRNEVLMLRKQGHTVRTFSVRRADTSQLLSEFHRQEVQTTTYLLSDHRIELIVAALQLLVKTPVRFLQGVLLSLRTKAPGLWGFVTQTAYFFEACLLARELQQKKIAHLHNHIGENSASVAMLASTLSGVPYSMTIHGPYIFRAPEKWALGEKIERSAFTVCITEFTKSQCMIYAAYPCWDKLHVVHCCPDPAFGGRRPAAPHGREAHPAVGPRRERPPRGPHLQRGARGGDGDVARLRAPELRGGSTRGIHGGHGHGPAGHRYLYRGAPRAH